MDESIGFGLYQSCRNRGSVGRVSLFGLRRCGWCRWGAGASITGAGAIAHPKINSTGEYIILPPNPKVSSIFV